MFDQNEFKKINIYKPINSYKIFFNLIKTNIMNVDI